MKCKTPGRGIDPQVLKDNHKIKMEQKRIMREHFYNEHQDPFILANLSKNHPHYGDTPRENEARKNNS